MAWPLYKKFDQEEKEETFINELKFETLKEFLKKVPYLKTEI